VDGSSALDLAAQAFGKGDTISSKGHQSYWNMMAHWVYALQILDLTGSQVGISEGSLVQNHYAVPQTHGFLEKLVSSLLAMQTSFILETSDYEAPGSLAKNDHQRNQGL
jgi:hypothetical protein